MLEIVVRTGRTGAEAVAEVIRCWHADRSGRPRPVNVRELWEHLVGEYGYQGSYRSVLRYVRSHYPKPRVRTYRRVETPRQVGTSFESAQIAVNVHTSP